MRLLLCFVAFALWFSSLASVPAQGSLEFELVPGPNVVVVDSFVYPLFVSQLFDEYPSVQSVTVEMYGERYGFVRAFGGVGTNFLVEQGFSYEVVVSDPVTLVLR
jgi:hypothetical protein